MDKNKFDIVLDLMEHPTDYQEEKIESILSDTGIKETYNLLCKIESTLASADCPADVDAEWQSFSQTHRIPKSHNFWNAGRAASISVITLTSLAAVAIGITLAVKTFVAKHQQTGDMAVTSVSKNTNASETSEKDSILDTQDDTVSNTPVVFEDASLEKIIFRVAETFGATVVYNDTATAQLHLYYKFDPTIPLTETVEQLNTFEHINIRITGTKIIVD